MRTGRLLEFGALFLAAALVGCAGGGGGRGSSGFDVTAEESAIVQALNIQLCVDFEGLTICPVAETSTPRGATPTPGGAPSLETTLGNASSIECFQSTPGGPCTVTMTFVSHGFAPGSTFRALSRVGGAANPWVLGSDPVPDSPSEPLSFASALVLASPQGGPPATVQLAVLAFAALPPSSSMGFDQLHQTAATFAFVTQILAVNVLTAPGPPTPTALPTSSPTATSTAGANDCCQCPSSCAAVVDGACDGGCTLVFGASCFGERLCTLPTPSPTATPSATPTPTPSATSETTPSATSATRPSATPTTTPSATPASSPDWVFVSNDETLSVIDPGINRVIATIPMGGGPLGVAVAPSGAFAYVGTNSGAVYVVDAGSLFVTGTIAVGGEPFAVAFSPNGAFAYVTNMADNSVSTIDVATSAVVGPSIAVGDQPASIAVTPDGAFNYVVNLCGTNPCNAFSTARGTVSIINAASSLVATTVPVGYRPVGMRISPDGMFAYVANQCGEDPSCQSEGTISVISTMTQTLVDTIHIGSRADHSAQFVAQFVALTPDGRFAYVANTCGNNPPPCSSSNGSVSVIDLDMRAVVGTPIAVGRAAGDIAITPDGAFAYVANQISDTVSVINVGTHKVDATIPVGSHPTFLAIVGER